MFYLKHAFNCLINPLTVGIVLAMAGALLVMLASARRRLRVVGCICVFAGAIWLYLWGCAPIARLVGVPLERKWPIVKAEDSPSADAIVVLGGGMCFNLAISPYGEMNSAADRVWHAWRLYRVGKAPLVITSGSGDLYSTVPLLRDFGVPESAILAENSSRNTEENARFVERTLKERLGGIDRRPKALIVTSASHMTRAMMMFGKFAPGLEVFPAATDYEASVHSVHPFRFEDMLPSADILMYNTTFAKEWIGQLAYKIIGR